MKSADRLPITLARLERRTAARIFPIPGFDPDRHHVTSSPSQSTKLRNAPSTARNRDVVAIDLSSAQYRPGNARHLVGECHCDKTNGFACEKLCDPLDPAGDVLALVADKTCGADNKERFT